MIEFMLALPILLFVIFGIIEFARLTFSWMAVQNAARFGIRYAVTGQYNEVYCALAGNILGLDYINADTYGGDHIDCLVPSDYPGSDGTEKEQALTAPVLDPGRGRRRRIWLVGGSCGLWRLHGLYLLS